MTRGSLPNLRSDSVGGENSGDSTESLIDEAEDYLRRSIDSMLTISSASTDYWNKQTAKRRRARRHSEPDLIRDWHPPQDARPYLPKVYRSDYCCRRESTCVILNKMLVRLFSMQFRMQADQFVFDNFPGNKFSHRLVFRTASRKVGQPFSP